MDGIVFADFPVGGGSHIPVMQYVRSGWDRRGHEEAASGPYRGIRCGALVVVLPRFRLPCFMLALHH